MKICVIGGSGFIGTCLCRRLTANSGISVINVDKVQSRSYSDITKIADVRIVRDLLSAVPDADVIINLAAEHSDDVRPRTLYREVNVLGAENICAVARKKDIRKIIFTSSVAVYGFAPIGTDETASIAPFNEYGRTKADAEEVYRSWQSERPHERTLIIVRPTVVFGENNRGNVYNLLKQMAADRFIMVGSGCNRKSIAYVENVAAFLEYVLDWPPGLHISNYVDKPDFTMNEFVKTIQNALGMTVRQRVRVPYVVGYAVGTVFDGLSLLTGRKFVVSAIRVKKFAADSVYNTNASEKGFEPPVPLREALKRTAESEFLRVR